MSYDDSDDKVSSSSEEEEEEKKKPVVKAKSQKKSLALSSDINFSKNTSAKEPIELEEIVKIFANDL